MTSLTPQSLLLLLAEVEAGDPIDFADLPFDEQDLRTLACLNVVEFLRSDDYVSSTWEEREKIFAAAMARLVLENLALHARLLLGREGS